MFRNTQTPVILKEKVNLKVAEKLSKLTFTKFKTLFDLSTTKRGTERDYLTEFKKIKNYTSNIMCGLNTINYSYTEGKNIGRLQSRSPSMQRQFNGFRGPLCDGLVLDIDICNCHPTFMINLCKQHKIPFNYLNDYVTNRESKLSEVMNTYKITRSQAKTFFLTCINDVNLKIYIAKDSKKKIKKGFAKSFNKEVVTIIQKLYNIYKDDEKYAPNFKPKKDSDYDNIPGQFVNSIFCDLEDITLRRGIEACIQKDLMEESNIMTLMYDGFMMDNINVDKKILIETLNNEFLTEGIKWDIKPHNTELIEAILASDEVNCDFEGENLIEIIKYIVNVDLKGKLVKCKGITYYMGDSTITRNKEAIHMDLYDYISEKNYIMNDGKKQIVVSKMPVYIKQIIEGIINKCEKANNFADDVWRETHKKIFFKNGYFDFELKKFVEGSFNRTFVKIDRDYTESNDTSLRDSINKKIFHPIFTIDDTDDREERIQLYKYFMHSTAHNLAGDVSRKKWTLLQGMRNSGKGIIGDLLKNSFQDYVMTTNSSNFSIKKGVVDSQKALSWLIDYQFVRVALTSEISIDEKIDGIMIKKFTSGGDYMSARKNFCDEMTFKIQASLIMCCNDCPEIKPTDALDYCDEINMKSKFIDSSENVEKFKGFKYYQKDDNLKNEFLHSRDILNEMVNMFIEAYYTDSKFPENLKKQSDDMNNETSDYSKIKNLFQITDDDKATIGNKELREIIKQNNILFSLKKVKQLLMNEGAKEHRGKKERGLKNIILIEDDSDEEEEESANVKLLDV